MVNLKLIAIRKKSFTLEMENRVQLQVKVKMLLFLFFTLKNNNQDLNLLKQIKDRYSFILVMETNKTLSMIITEKS